MRILIPLLLLCLNAHAEEAGVTPYRPSASSPAALPAVGQLELELGGLKTGGRRSLPYLFKLALNEDWAVLAGGEAWVKDGSERGVGDTSLTLKRAIPLDASTVLGFELGVKAPTAKDSIGSGKTDFIWNNILSQDIGAVHLDTNLNWTRIGAAGVGEGRVQTGLSASLSTPLNEQWGVGVEWAGTRRAGTPFTAQALLAFSYMPHKRLSIDVGVAHGLNGASNGLSLFTGIVLPLANLR